MQGSCSPWILVCLSKFSEFFYKKKISDSCSPLFSYLEGDFEMMKVDEIKREKNNFFLLSRGFSTSKSFRAVEWSARVPSQSRILEMIP